MVRKNKDYYVVEWVCSTFGLDNVPSSIDLNQIVESHDCSIEEYVKDDLVIDDKKVIDTKSFLSKMVDMVDLRRLASEVVSTLPTFASCVIIEILGYDELLLIVRRFTNLENISLLKRATYFRNHIISMVDKDGNSFKTTLSILEKILQAFIVSNVQLFVYQEQVEGVLVDRIGLINLDDPSSMYNAYNAKKLDTFVQNLKDAEESVVTNSGYNEDMLNKTQIES